MRLDHHTNMALASQAIVVTALLSISNSQAFFLFPGPIIYPKTTTPAPTTEPPKKHTYPKSHGGYHHPYVVLPYGYEESEEETTTPAPTTTTPKPKPKHTYRPHLVHHYGFPPPFYYPHPHHPSYKHAPRYEEEEKSPEEETTPAPKPTTAKPKHKYPASRPYGPSHYGGPPSFYYQHQPYDNQEYSFTPPSKSEEVIEDDMMETTTPKPPPTTKKPKHSYPIPPSYESKRPSYHGYPPPPAPPFYRRRPGYGPPPKPKSKSSPVPEDMMEGKLQMMEAESEAPPVMFVTPVNPVTDKTYRPQFVENSNPGADGAYPDHFQPPKLRRPISPPIFNPQAKENIEFSSQGADSEKPPRDQLQEVTLNMANFLANQPPPNQPYQFEMPEEMAPKNNQPSSVQIIPSVTENVSLEPPSRQSNKVSNSVNGLIDMSIYLPPVDTPTRQAVNSSFQDKTASRRSDVPCPKNHRSCNPTSFKERQGLPSLPERQEDLTRSRWNLRDSVSGTIQNVPQNQPCPPNHRSPCSNAFVRRGGVYDVPLPQNIDVRERWNLRDSLRNPNLETESRQFSSDASYKFIKEFIANSTRSG